MTVALFRPELAIDPVHDGRHALADHPLKRESIPDCGVMPKEKIALFTYTWVNKDSVAGAAFGIWGPGVGDQAIAGHLPDRPTRIHRALPITGVGCAGDRRATAANIGIQPKRGYLYDFGSHWI